MKVDLLIALLKAFLFLAFDTKQFFCCCHQMVSINNIDISKSYSVIVGYVYLVILASVDLYLLILKY